MGWTIPNRNHGDGAAAVGTLGIVVLPLQDLWVRVLSARQDMQGQWHLDLAMWRSNWTPQAPEGNVEQEVMVTNSVTSAGPPP